MKKQFFLITTLFLISACAIVKAPQGGPKDAQAPKIMSQYPANNTTSFRDNKIMLFFDEYVSLSNFNTEVKINPYIDPSRIQTVIKGKKIELKLPLDLDTNTTYNINFGKSIVDLTEGNPILNFNIVFSSGANLDTLSLKGSTFCNLPKTTPITIGLYSQVDSLDPSQDKALYYTKTNQDKFLFTNLKNDSYRMYAFTDINNNNLYDSLTEYVGFSDELVYSTKKDSLAINLFKEDTRKFKFNRPIYKDNFVELEFSKGLEKVTSEQPYLYNPKTRKLNIYEAKGNIDNFKITVKDSLGNTIDTNLTVLKSGSKLLDSTLQVIRVDEYDNQKPFEGIKLSLSHKLKSYTVDSIKYILNKDTLKAPNKKVIIKLDNEKNTLSFEPINNKDTLMVVLNNKTINSYSAHYNKKQIFVYVPTLNKQFSKISGTILTKEPNYILYLLDKSNNILYSQRNPKKIELNYLNAGQYKIKILIDANNNGLYDTGNIKEKRQAERFYYYEKPLDLKSNWEQGNVNITF